MTDPQDHNENADEQTPDKDAQQQADSGEREAENLNAPGDSEAANDFVDDELPEEEELTPELIEEEAIRGDFMLRWAVIFLALLFGFSQIADTRSLVHIRSGNVMRANGFLPSAQDNLSYATEGTSVSNVSWLFDHVVSGVYSIGGDAGLTFFKALVAGLVAFLLSIISVRGMPTWWSSICCAFAITACSIDFLPLTDLVTLLGLATTLLWLHRYDEDGNSGIVWKLPVLTVLWANMDPRAYIGVIAVCLFAVGSKLRQSKSVKAGDGPGANVSVLWKAVAFSVLALAINPSPVASLLSPVTTYSVEYPGRAMMQPVIGSSGQPTDAATMLDGRTEYSQLWVPEVFNGFELAYIAGLFLIIIAFVVIGVSRDHNDLPWGVTLTGFTILAGIALHELPVAALVAAITAGLAAQRWYARTFRQEYSIDTAEVLFSRGGRAITVFALAVLAFLVVADRLPTRTPVGLGFESDLKATITSVGDELAEIPKDERILNTRLSQGDLLIWHGRQSFIDSRITPFGRSNDDSSLLSRFDSLRKSLLLKKKPATDEAGSLAEDAVAEVDPSKNENWPEEFAAFNLSKVMLRLAPPGPPAYSLVQAFRGNSAWMLTSRGASSVYFKHVADADAAATESAKFDILQLAFQAQAEKVPSFARIDFGRESDFYSKYVYGRRPNLTAAHRLAQNYFALDSQIPPQLIANAAVAAFRDLENNALMENLGAAVAGPILTIRNANSVLFDDPQNAGAYRLLGMAYQRLAVSESAMMQSLRAQGLDSMRSLQAIMALRQATTIDPNDADSWFSMVSLYQNRNQPQLALECLERYLDLSSDEIFDSGPDGEERLSQLHDTRLAWADQCDAVKMQVEDVLATADMPEDPQQMAQQKLMMASQLFQDGYARLSLTMINENIDLLRAIPQAEVLHGTVLMEVGELDEADKVLNQLASYAKDNGDRPELTGLNWHAPVALIRIAKGDYEGARSAWNDKLQVIRQAERNIPQIFNMLAQTLPLAVAARPTSGMAVWPVVTLQTAQLPVGAIQKGMSEPTLMTAMIDLEAGRVNDARRGLKKLLSEFGDTPYRAFASVYYSQMADDAGVLVRDSLWNPWEEFEIVDAETGTDAAEPVDETKPADPATEASSPQEKGGDTPKDEPEINNDSEATDK